MEAQGHRERLLWGPRNQKFVINLGANSVKPNNPGQKRDQRKSAEKRKESASGNQPLLPSFGREGVVQTCGEEPKPPQKTS